MTQEQQIRAFSLLIAEVKNQGKFTKLKKGQSYIIELNDRQEGYLKAIENYIADKNFWPVSDEGQRLSGEVS